MRRAAAFLIAVSAAIAFAGCGETSDNDKDFSGREKEVATAIDDISSHARKLEARKICDGFMTTQLKAKLTAEAKKRSGTDCADQLKDSIRDVDVFDFDITAIDVSGNTATVRFEIDTNADPDPTGTLELVEQRGWRISKLP